MTFIINQNDVGYERTWGGTYLAGVRMTEFNSDAPRTAVQMPQADRYFEETL